MSSMRGHHSHWEATSQREEAGMLSIMSSMRGQLSHWEAVQNEHYERPTFSYGFVTCMSVSLLSPVILWLSSH